MECLYDFECVFLQKFKFDYTKERYLRRCLTEDVVRQIQTDVAIQQELETEFDQLQQDRENIRAIFPTGDSKVKQTKRC